MSALKEVMDERLRQIEEKGWTTEHDDGHDRGELAKAAGCYALHAGVTPIASPPAQWPWDIKWWKPKSRRRDLIRAAALILAEIERLDRLSPPGDPQ